MVEHWSEHEPYREKTPRESLKESMESQRKESYFLHTRELQSGDRSYETAGASSGPLRNSDYCEAYMLFIKMLEAGWKLPKDSLFYEVSWECLAITAIELRDEYETLPDWPDEMQVLVDSMPGSHAIEIPVLLECDKTLDLTFEMADGSQAVCYINRIYMVDIWEEQERALCAVRCESYADGVLLTSLETAPNYRGRGYATQLLGAVLMYLEAGKVYVHIHINNQASLSVHLKCGFQKVKSGARMLDGSYSREYDTYLTEIP